MKKKKEENCSNIEKHKTDLEALTCQGHLEKWNQVFFGSVIYLEETHGDRIVFEKRKKKKRKKRCSRC
jgi:hypothetical protein